MFTGDPMRAGAAQVVQAFEVEEKPQSSRVTTGRAGYRASRPPPREHGDVAVQLGRAQQHTGMASR